MGNDTVSGGQGGDWVVGGKDNDRLFGDDGDDIVYGNLGNDTCDGGTGADLVRGGQGDDLLAGGAGDDFLSGDLGEDTMSGGSGADIFNSFGTAGTDRVTDFNRAEGDRVRLEPGSTWTASQVGADTVVDITGGGRVVPGRRLHVRPHRRLDLRGLEAHGRGRAARTRLYRVFRGCPAHPSLS